MQNIKKKTSIYILFLSFFLFISKAQAEPTVIDIFGPGQQLVNVSLATPLTAPNTPATELGPQLDSLIRDNLSYLTFMYFVPEIRVLGGTVLDSWKAPEVDFKRFQIAGADLLITQAWLNGDASGSTVELRVFETFSGQFIFGNAYSGVTPNTLPTVADKFCSGLMEELTGNGSFFNTTLAFAKDTGTGDRDIWLVSPVGRGLRQLTDLRGIAMSPAWSPDGRYVVFGHINNDTHGLGIWDRIKNSITRVRFPGNTVIGPAFMPNNKVAVGLSTSGNPDIFLLDYSFNREMALERTSAINVSPTFDATGKYMAFTSNRLGGPQIFLKDLEEGKTKRVSMKGSYNTEASLSSDGTLVAFTRMTDNGHRIFVQDLVTGTEKQVTFGPGRDEHPSFAPDSYFLAFTSDRSGTSQIYLTTRHGGDAKRVPTGSGAVSFPRWGLIPE